MRYLMLIGLALQSLSRNKMRSFLTMLGVIIGVGSVIAMVALGQGASASVQSSIASLGTNVLTVYGGSAAVGGVRQGAASTENLTAQDLDALRRDCPSAQFVSPLLRKAGQVVAASNNWGTQVQGVNPDYLKIRDWRCQLGSPFDATQTAASAKVCVIGQTVRMQLFGTGDGVGSVLRINSVPLMVIGVLQAKGQTSFGQDQDDAIFVPYTTFMNRLFGGEKFSMIIMSAVSDDQVETARRQITSLLRQRHHIGSAKDDDFSVRTQQETAQMAEKTTGVFTTLLGGIAAVSLLVGGIGIMNIMLVSVTERIREIGIRMAVGAHRRDILVQFFTEALVLSVLGGLLGILLGMAAIAVMTRVSPWAPLLSWGSVVLAFCCSAVVGVFFGYYPAQKAASLDPIEALRNE